MINITIEQKKMLLNYIPNIEKIIQSDDVNELLLPLDDLITEIGFDENYELNQEGLILQKIYDQIYNQN